MGAVAMQQVAQLKPRLLLHISAVSRMPLHLCLPTGLWTSSAGAWRNICQQDTNMLYALARSRGTNKCAMGQINRKGLGAALPG